MSTYSVRCRDYACRHRRVIDKHPDEYIRPPACTVCGSKKGWRIEQRTYNKRGLCRCSGLHFPHRPHHPMCDQHPRGAVNQALRSGAHPFDDIPIEHMGVPCTSPAAPF